MEMFVFIVYSALAYWAAGQTIYANKIQIGTMKNIFLNIYNGLFCVKPTK